MGGVIECQVSDFLSAQAAAAAAAKILDGELHFERFSTRNVGQ